MPIKAGWLIEGRVLIGENWGELTVNEYNQFAEYTYNMWTEATRGYVILDQMKLEKQPPITEMVKARIHENVKMLLDVTPPAPGIEFGSTVTLHSMGVERRAERTMADAIAHLSKREPELEAALQNAKLQWLVTFNDSADAQPQ